MWKKIDTEGREDLLGCWAGKLWSWTPEIIYMPKEVVVWVKSIGIVQKVANASDFSQSSVGSYEKETGGKMALVSLDVVESTGDAWDHTGLSGTREGQVWKERPSFEDRMAQMWKQWILQNRAEFILPLALELII